MNFVILYFLLFFLTFNTPALMCVQTETCIYLTIQSPPVYT